MKSFAFSGAFDSSSSLASVFSSASLADRASKSAACRQYFRNVEKREQYILLKTESYLETRQSVLSEKKQLLLVRNLLRAAEETVADSQDLREKSNIEQMGWKNSPGEYRTYQPA